MGRGDVDVACLSHSTIEMTGPVPWVTGGRRRGGGGGENRRREVLDADFWTKWPRAVPPTRERCSRRVSSSLAAPAAAAAAAAAADAAVLGFWRGRGRAVWFDVARCGDRTRTRFSGGSPGSM